MKAILALICVSIALFRSAEGITCWTCENAESIEQCDLEGKLIECNDPLDVCGMEVRHGGQRPTVHKFCKQKNACNNIQNQNAKQAWDISQCNPKIPSSVCRCCCEHNNCNRGGLRCLDAAAEPEICTPTHVSPAHGGVDCSDGSKVGSVCTFRCDGGYYISGYHFSVCELKGEVRMWSEPAPTCQPITCPKIPEFKFGSIECSNNDRVGSECRFSCNSGYRLVGAEISVCEEKIKGYEHGEWSTSEQFCERKRCQEKLSSPANGDMVCTDGDFTASLCHFSCHDDFDMFGAYYVKCEEGDMYGKPYWNDIAPICKLKECVHKPMAPRNGRMECTDGKIIHSVCKFYCDSEYYLTGSMDTICVSGAYYGYQENKLEDYNTPHWTNKEPICERKYCDADLAAPTHGSMYCTDGEYIGSTCSFECDKTHFLVGSMSSSCLEYYDAYMPKWNNEAPVCKPKRCGSPPSAPKHGSIKCSNIDFLGSACQFICDKAFYRKGSEVAVCVEDYKYGKLSWDNKTPECIRKECDVSPISPANGYVECSDSNYLGSICYYTCDLAYGLVGSEQTTCLEDYKYMTLGWNNEQPQCIKKECAYLPSVPYHGYMYCNDGMYYGSLCTFKCDDDYNLVGATTTKCAYPLKKAYGKQPEWDYESPVCERKMCYEAVVPENGAIVCSDKNFIHSECEYVCDSYHRRVGALYTTCKEDYSGYMKWSAEAPVCERIECRKLTNIKNGMIDCSDDEYVNSECKFKCTVDDYRLSPNTRHSITCQNDTMWSADPPCCARSCPPFAVMDLVVVLDSSSSIGAPSWKIMLNFVNNIFDLFVVQKDAMNFAVVRYNKEIDTDTQINLDECPDSIEMLKELVSKIPYNGSGTWTGQAIDYARTNMLLPEVGNREVAPDVVLVITDGRSQDDVKIPSEALRSQGVLTFALGITPTNGKLDMEQLKDIAGAPERLFLAKEGFGTLTPEFAKEISENICGDPCDRPIY
ncbi:P-selectin-like [Styela clava]